jgi:K+-sensing histidine kinase KdpD
MASINKSVTNLKSYFTGGLPPIDDSIDPVQPKGVASGKSSSRWQGYLFGSLLVVLTTSVGYLLRDVLVPTNTVMLYLLAIVITATAWGLIPSIMASVLCCYSIFFSSRQRLLFGYTTRNTSLLFWCL